MTKLSQSLDPYTPERKYHECPECEYREASTERIPDCPECGAEMRNIAVPRE